MQKSIVNQNEDSVSKQLFYRGNNGYIADKDQVGSRRSLIGCGRMPPQRTSCPFALRLWCSEAQGRTKWQPLKPNTMFMRKWITVSP